MREVTRNKIINLISRGQYNRVVISEDFKKYAVFGLNEKYLNESAYFYEIIIDDRWRTYSYNSIKKEIYEFWENTKNIYFQENITLC